MESIKRSVIIALVVSLAGCGSGPAAVSGRAVTSPSEALGQAGYSAMADGSTYILRPSDSLKINVFREADLSVDSVIIAPDGTISVPLLGAVTATGMTADELARKLEQLYSANYLRHPHVSVNVLEYTSYQVTVEGAVNRPGLYSFRPGTKLSGAIALAQGMSRVAKSRDLAVFRQKTDGVYIAKFDYRAVSSGTMLDPVLEPGDRIVIGTNGLSQFWQDLLSALPAFALFTRI